MAQENRPNIVSQANAIFDSGVPVSAMLVLDLDDNEVVERSKGRRIDPETKILYHVDYSPAENSDVAARLEKRPKDAEADFADLCSLRITRQLP